MLDYQEKMGQGIVCWYKFKQNANILFINAPSSIEDFFCECDHQKKYDYVIYYGGLSCNEYKSTFCSIKSKLSSDGRVIFIFNNDLGVRYFCGQKKEGYNYSHEEFASLLEELGLNSFKFYSVFPNYQRPQLIFSENYALTENMRNRYIPWYDSVVDIYEDESLLCEKMSKNGVIHQFANSFFVECSVNGEHSDIEMATLALDRGLERSTITIIHSDYVEKKAYYECGISNIYGLRDNLEYLKQRGLAVVDAKIEGGKLIMPHMQYKLANVYLQGLLLSDSEAFLRAFDEYYNAILKSSIIERQGELGPILEKGFLDLVPLNSFWDGHRYVFFDQEYVEESVPALMMLLRSIMIVYDAVDEEQVLVKREELFKRYEMLDLLDDLYSLERDFVLGIRDNQNVIEMDEKHQIFSSEVLKNRQRIFDDCYRTQLFETLMQDCFEFDSKEVVYLWGTGVWADKFMAFYGNEYQIQAVFDNNTENVGQVFHGVPIICSAELNKLPNNVRIIVCTKSYVDIVPQLLHLGKNNIGIYDAHRIYNGRQNVKIEKSAFGKRKYHVGYVSGVFDLYHIGHINMFRRAKEYCDYLIVAVATDEYVRNQKKREPFIPLDERVECVKSCKYVDEVFVTPYEYGGIIEAFQKFHFDVQFCGSDYENNTWWLQQKEWLEAHGAHLEFLSYTTQTSSTKIKQLIERKLL
ncbi:cytidyltransferase-like domain-containing protein [Pseudobutyrivibrio sp. C4]|uniref:adenylyltransferase/cytidyltransferase family protein n=1 Tax=Pseudobutyrivibrio sp. C4 TaxID=1520803 RepID=UPI0008D446F1|nr:adenylyltransferase/cytidyltransferase family protein [Pseudobutyrivibrio sp. C4]SET25337.1 cytidyltransferase-like domain-containing protein [Pseudobutyrivibrio sp. C4]